MNGKQVRLASISGQPLLLSKGRYNLRKLHELPVQLIRSQRWDELKNEVLCNFYWLKTKIEVRSLRWGKFFWLALEYWIPWPWMKARLELNFVLLEISLLSNIIFFLCIWIAQGFLSKGSRRQPRFHSKARLLSIQLLISLLPMEVLSRFWPSSRSTWVTRLLFCSGFLTAWWSFHHTAATSIITWLRSFSLLISDTCSSSHGPSEQLFCFGFYESEGAGM